MYDKFYALPEEKRLKIINAALEVFAKNDYKHAVTDDIAAKASISKGLLFYYFKNKSNLYSFIYKYVGEVMLEQVVDEKFNEISDLFELLEYAGEKKYMVLNKLPYSYEFAMRAFFSSVEDVDKEINKVLDDYSNLLENPMFKNIDFTKFKAGVDINKILQLLVWAMEGYFMERQRMNKPLEIDEMMKEYKSWLLMFKNMSYKEEFL